MEIPTEHVHVLNIDSGVNQESHRTTLIKKNRKPKDFCYVFAFLLLLAAWIALSSLGFFDPNSTKYKLDETSNYTKMFINAPVTKLSALLPISVLLGVTVIYFCLFVYEKCINSCINISVVIVIFGMISSFISFLIPIYSLKEDGFSIIKFIRLRNEKELVAAILILIYYSIYILPYSIYMITSVVSIFNVDMRILRDIAKDSCRLIYRSPSLVLFASLISILGFLALSFTFNALIVTNSVFDGLNNFLCFVMILGGTCALDFIINFARMVISEYTINSLHANDEIAVIGPIIWKTIRNRIGTAMLASTWFVSLICSIIQALKHSPKWRIKENYIFYIVTKVALVTMPDTALIFSLIYGTGFLKSCEKTFEAVLRRSKIYMASLLVIQGLVAIISLALIIPIGLMFIIIMSVTQPKTTEDWIKEISIVSYGVAYIFFVFWLLIFSTMKARLINKIISLNEKDYETEEKANMVNRFR